MSLAITTNVSSMVAQNSLAKTQTSLSTSFARLSSGMRINSAADDAAGLGISKSMNAQVHSYAVAAITKLDAGIQTLSGIRANYGAAMNRFQNTISNLQTMQTNTSASLSRIRDADIAMETATLSKNQVLSQAGAAILGQANQTPQMALSLLKG